VPDHQPSQPPAPDEIILLRGLFKFFGDVVAVQGVDLTVRRGQVVVLIGPSGSGKSTVLRCINRLERPTAGEVWVDGILMTAPNAPLDAVRAEIGMVFQQFNLYPHLTVLENVALAQRVVRRRSRAAAQSHAMALLEKVGIPEQAPKMPSELSGGQQQRVGIARALAMDPKIMLFDEPTSALDPEMIKEVLDVMLALAEEGMTMVVASHEMGFARNAADEIVLLDHGQIVEQNAPAAFFDHPQHERTRRFLSQILY
jgi:ABC-type polar amino acid transport system ATPase subunit